MTLQGKVWKFGAHIDTDLIIAARYLNTSEPSELAKYVMEDADPEFVSKMSEGDIIVAGENFGCGSSREHAPIALKAAGVAAIIHALFPWLYTFYTSETIIRLYWTTLHASGRHADLIEKWKPNNIKITECRTPSKYASPVIERYVPQAEPAEVESHPSHNWRPGNKGPRDEI